MSSDGVATIQNEVNRGKDPVTSEASLLSLSNETLAEAFVSILKRLKRDGTKLTDALREDKELRAVLVEFQCRLYDQAAEDAEHGALLRIPRSV